MRTTGKAFDGLIHLCPAPRKAEVPDGAQLLLTARTAAFNLQLTPHSRFWWKVCLSLENVILLGRSSSELVPHDLKAVISTFATVDLCAQLYERI